MRDEQANARPLRRLLSLSATLATFATAQGCAWHESDDALVQRFRSHRGEFEELVALARANPAIASVKSDDVGGRDPRPEVVKRIRELMDAVDVETLYMPSSDGANEHAVINRVEFIGPLIISNGVKGLLWSAEELPVHPEPLDAVKSWKRGDKFYRRIDDGWYLFLRVS